MKKIKNIENLLNQLYSNEGKANAISQLVGKVNIPDKLILKAIKIYEEELEYFRLAAEIAENAGMDEKARELYKKASEEYDTQVSFLDSAAYFAKKAGMEERAKELYKKAIEHQETRGDFKKASKLAEEAGLSERAKLYKTLGLI